MTAFAAMAGVFQAMVVRGTTPALIGTALMLFLLGLEVMEPLSQEVDQPDRTDSLPIERGELLVRHLVAPAVALVPFAVVAAAAAVAVLGTSRAIAPGGDPGAADGARRRRRRSRQHRARRTRSRPRARPQAFVPPEMAGHHHRDARRPADPGQRARRGTVLLVRRAEQLGTSVDRGCTARRDRRLAADVTGQLLGPQAGSMAAQVPAVHVRGPVLHQATAEHTGMTELATRQLTKTYGDRPALEPLTLAIDSGAKVALVGHNGSGKTTLMKMAAGLLDPTDGSVQDRSPRRRHARGPSAAVVAQRHADVLRRSVAVGAPRVRRPAARRHRLAGTRRGAARADRPHAAPRRHPHARSAAACARRQRSRWRSSDRSSCCSSTSRSSVSTSPASRRCSRCSTPHRSAARRW